MAFEPFWDYFWSSSFFELSGANIPFFLSFFLLKNPLVYPIFVLKAFGQFSKFLVKTSNSLVKKINGFCLGNFKMAFEPFWHHFWSSSFFQLSAANIPFFIFFFDFFNSKINQCILFLCLKHHFWSFSLLNFLRLISHFFIFLIFSTQKYHSISDFCGSKNISGFCQNPMGTFYKLL